MQVFHRFKYKFTSETDSIKIKVCWQFWKALDERPGRQRIYCMETLHLTIEKAYKPSRYVNVSFKTESYHRNISFVWFLNKYIHNKMHVSQ